MYRKLSGGNARRSSQPQRLSSVPLEVPEEKKDMKKSLIPRLTSRASSMEEVNKAGRSSSVEGSEMRKRTQSVEHLSQGLNSAITPRLKNQTPVCGAAVSTTRKTTVRRDTRALTDKNFQHTELSKVRDYLLSENLLDASDVLDINSKISLKLFLSVMTVLFKKYYPGVEITVSNYTEVLPVLLKQIKYPGKVARSWLITVNTAHSWPHVLGVMSWLVNLLTSFDKIIWETDEEDILDSKGVENMMEYIGMKYREDVEGKSANEEEDRQFFEALVKDRVVCLQEQGEEQRKRVMELETSVENPLIDSEMAEFQRKKNALKRLEDNLKSEQEEYNQLCCSKEELFLEKEMFESKINDLNEQLSDSKGAHKIVLEKYGSKENLLEHICKMKSELLHLENVMQYQKTVEEDITSQIYRIELGIARTRSLLDKESVSRGAVVRELACAHPELQKLQVSIPYAHPSASSMIKEYRALLQQAVVEKKRSVQELEKQVSSHQAEKEKREAEEKAAFEESEVLQSELFSLEREMKQLKEAGAEEIRQLNLKELELKQLYEQKVRELEEKTNEDIELQEKLKEAENEILLLTKDYEETKERYTANLNRMRDNLLEHIKKLLDARDEILNFK